MSITIDRREYPERLIPESEAAELLGVATGTLANWRGTGRGPRVRPELARGPSATRARPSRSS